MFSGVVVGLYDHYRAVEFFPPEIASRRVRLTAMLAFEYHGNDLALLFQKTGNRL